MFDSSSSVTTTNGSGAFVSSLRYLAGRGDAELVSLIEDVCEHNSRRVQRSSTRRLEVKPATGETRRIVVRDRASTKAGTAATDCESDRVALASFLRVVERLQEAVTRKSGDCQSAAIDHAEAIGWKAFQTRLREHCEGGCSVTGVRVTHVRLHDEASGRMKPCAPLISPKALPDEPGEPDGAGDFAGAFALAPQRLAAAPALQVTLHNILGRTRPVVPVYVELEVTAGLTASTGACERRLRAPTGIFVYAEDLAPGDSCELRIASAGLLDRLPCPASLIREARLLLWLPRPRQHAPLPRPSEAVALRPVA